MSFEIKTPLEVFTDIDGDPLKNGYIYIGEQGLNPESNPVSVFWDANLTIPAAQPIRTISGYASRDGSPGRIYTSENYSILVLNKNRSLVYSDLDAANPKQLDSRYIRHLASLENTSDPSDTSTARGAKGLSAGMTIAVASRFAGSDGGGGFWLAVPLASVTPNGHNIVQCVGTEELALVLIIQPSMDVRSFGFSSSIADNSAAMVAALSTSVQELVGQLGVEYRYSSDITSIGKTIRFKDLTMVGEDAEMTLQGVITLLGNLTSGGLKNSNVISYGSAVGVAKGDLLIIEDQIPSSFSQHRAEYTDGEFNRVRDISGTDLLMQNHLRGVGNYPIAATTKIFKLTPISVILDNSQFITRNGAASYSLTIRYGDKLRFNQSDVKGLGNNFGALLLDKCYDIEINGGNYLHDGANIGLNYGINLSSCQSVNINRSDTYGTRHAITTGSDADDGSVPCRDVKVRDATLSNDTTSLVFAADFHGNTSDSGYYDCHIDGDIGLAGENIDCIGNTIIGRRYNPIIELQEIVGGIITIEGNKTEIGDGFSFDKIIGFSSSTLSQKVDREFEMNISDISCEVNNGVVRLLTMLYNQDNAVKSTLDFRNINVKGDTTGLTDVAQLARSGSGANPDQVSISDLKFPASALTEFVTLSGAFTGTTLTLPAQRMPDTPLTIAAAGHESSSGGTGNTGLYLWDYANYPAVPHLSVDHNGWVRAGDPQFFGAIDSLTSGSAQLFLTTASSTITTPVERTISINATVTFDNVTL